MFDFLSQKRAYKIMNTKSQYSNRAYHQGSALVRFQSKTVLNLF